MEETIQPMSKKDYLLSVIAGIFIGILLLPMLWSAKPDLFIKVRFFIVPFFLIATPFGLAIAHLLGRKISLFWQLGKFAVTGALNFCVDLGVFSFLSFLFSNYLKISSKDLIFSGITLLTFYSLYKTISFILANINSYYWNKFWTFHKEGGNKAEFFQFFIVSIIGLIINVTMASVVFNLIDPVTGLKKEQWELVSAVAGSVAGLVWNFIGYKFIVFKK